MGRLEDLRGVLESRARRHVANRAEAAELAQEVIARCVAIRATHGERLLPYALAVLRNLVSRRWKRERRMLLVEELCADPVRRSQTVGLLEAPWPDFGVLEDREALSFLESRLQRIPAALREVCAPRWFGGKTYREIAASLGIDEPTARMRCFKARALLSNDPVVRAALGWHVLPLSQPADC